MVTLDVRPQEEQKTKVAVQETVDDDIDTSTWSYSMTSPGVRYYAFTRPQAIKTAGKANACRRVRP